MSGTETVYGAPRKFPRAPLKMVIPKGMQLVERREGGKDKPPLSPSGQKRGHQVKAQY